MLVVEFVFQNLGGLDLVKALLVLIPIGCTHGV